MTTNPSSNYSFNPWMQRLPIPAQRPEYWSNDDRMTAEAMLSDFSMSAEQIRATRPPVGNDPFPPRTGYEKRTLTLEDVLQIGPSTLMHDTATRQESGQPGTMGPSLGGW